MFGILIALNWAFFIPNQNTIVMLFVLSHSVDESFDFFPLFVFVFYYWWNLIGQDVSVFYSMLLLKMPKKKFEEISVKCSQFMHESFSKKKNYIEWLSVFVCYRKLPWLFDLFYGNQILKNFSFIDNCQVNASWV